MSKVRTEAGNCLNAREAIAFLEAIEAGIDTLELVSGDYSYRLEMIREANSLYLLEKIDSDGNVWGRCTGTAEDAVHLLHEVDMEQESVPASWLEVDTSVE